MSQDKEAPWPVDLAEVRIWPLEGEDGALLQELYDDLSDFDTAFGDRGRSDAVSTFVALPEGLDYDAKLLLGLWRNQGMAGVLDCLMGYPGPADWTVGALVVADRHRRLGIGRSVLDWLERTAVARGATRLRIVLREGNDSGRRFAQAAGYRPAESGRPGFVVVAKALTG